MKSRWLTALVMSLLAASQWSGAATGGDWRDLDGTWQCAVRPRGESTPKVYPRFIHVPCPIEGAWSELGRQPGTGERVWYRREFRVPKLTHGLRLHFGEVNWEANVWLNGVRLGVHHGDGPFSYDISGCLRSGELQELVVGVYNPRESPKASAAERRHAGSWRRGPTGILKRVWLG